MTKEVKNDTKTETGKQFQNGIRLKENHCEGTRQNALVTTGEKRSMKKNKKSELEIDNKKQELATVY